MFLYGANDLVEEGKLMVQERERGETNFWERCL